MISIVAGTTASAWYPPLSRLARQAWLWSAYWRLRPLWAALRQVIPEVTLPRPPGVRLNIRYRVDRRVIEIRDAELALRAYSPPEVPGRAEAAARCAGLDADEAVAVAEAAVIATALAARRDGQPPRLDGTPGKVTSTLPGNDLRAEAARLILVSRAFRRSPIVARIAGRAGGAAEQAGRLGELTVRSPSVAPRPLEAFDESTGLRPGRRQWLRLVTGLLVDQRGERLSVPFLFRAVHAPAEDELDELRIYIGYQQVHQLLPDLGGAAVIQQHVRELVQGDMRLVVGRRPLLVVDVVGVGGADPQAARDAGA